MGPHLTCFIPPIAPTITCEKRPSPGEKPQGGPRAGVAVRVRRAVAAALAVGIIASGTVPWLQVEKAEASGVAPIPINPYAKRRRVQAYERYLRELERELEQRMMGDVEGFTGLEAGKMRGARFRVAAISAFVASALSVLLVHPIDSLKVRLQGRKMGMVMDDVVGRGLRGLYRGVWSNVLKEAPNAAVYLGVYEGVKACLMGTPLADFPLAIFVIAGGIGDAVGSLVRVPAELVNKRLQLGLSSNWSEAVRECFFSPVGLNITMSSWLALLCRDVPYGGLQIAFYEFIRQSLIAVGKAGLPFDVLAGAISGFFASALTTPADVLVTRVSSQYPQCDLETKQLVGLRITLKRMIEKEGLTAFTDGIVERSLYYAPLIGLFFSLYEGTRFTLVHPELITSAVIGLEQVPHNLYAYFRGGALQVADAWSRADGLWSSLTTALTCLAQNVPGLKFGG